MTEENPSSSPDSELVSETSGDDFQLHPPRAVSAERGVAWISEGFSLFKQDAATWIGICIVGFIVLIVLSVVPVINLLTPFTSCIWVGGLMLGCYARYRGEKVEVTHLFEGFKKPMVPLLLTSLILAVVSGFIFFVSFMITLGPIIFKVITSGDPFALLTGGIDFLPLILAFLIVFALILPVMMMAWFAPALIAIHNVGIIKAMGMSFKACLKNIIPFSIYSTLLTLCYIVAMIPLFLGLLVIVPVFYTSIFASYKDIFVD